MHRLRHAVVMSATTMRFISRATPAATVSAARPGGCIIITHTTAAGTKFDALYGHVYGLRVKAGQRVRAGQPDRPRQRLPAPALQHAPGRPSTGTVTPMPGTSPELGRPRRVRGPGKFLRTNPRTAAYEPPALPRTEFTTASPPLQYGAADGAAYWTEEGGAGSVTMAARPRHRPSARRSPRARWRRPSTRAATTPSRSWRRRSVRRQRPPPGRDAHGQITRRRRGARTRN